MFCLNSNLFLVKSKLLRSYSRLVVAPDELGPKSRVYWFVAAVEVLLERQLISKLNSNLSGAEITSNFSTYK